ncbi:MAG: DUF86 domain-containing protein [Betaproteobacteria bacterium]
MSDARALDLLDQIIESAGLAQRYVEGLSLQAFCLDRRTRQAVTPNVLAIGEAAARLVQAYPDLAAQASNVPWAAKRGMRNRIAHGYFSV